MTAQTLIELLKVLQSYNKNGNKITSLELFNLELSGEADYSMTISLNIGIQSLTITTDADSSDDINEETRETLSNLAVAIV